MQPSSKQHGSLDPADRERIGRHFSLMGTVFMQLMGLESTGSAEMNALQQMGDTDRSALESIDGMEIRVAGDTTYITFEPSSAGFNELNEPLTITLNDGDRTPAYTYILQTSLSNIGNREE